MLGSPQLCVISFQVPHFIAVEARPQWLVEHEGPAAMLLLCWGGCGTPAALCDNMGRWWRWRWGLLSIFGFCLSLFICKETSLSASLLFLAFWSLSPSPQPCTPPLSTSGILVGPQCGYAFTFQQWPPDLLWACLGLSARTSSCCLLLLGWASWSSLQQLPIVLYLLIEYYCSWWPFLLNLIGHCLYNMTYQHIIK